MLRQAAVGAPAPGGAGWLRSSTAMPSGERVTWFTNGRTDAAAPVVVLVHGLGHWTQAAWDDFVPHVAQTHRIVALDLPGFGSSDEPDRPYTLAYFTDVVVRIIAETVGARPVGLVGHSYGGLIVANVAAHFAQRVRFLALIDPAGFLRTPKIVLRVAGSGPVSWAFRNVRPPARFVEASLDASVFDPTCLSPATRSRAVELARDPALTRAFARVYAGAMHEMLHLNRLHRSFRTWNGPTLLVWGEDDRYVPFAGFAHARAVYPQAMALALRRCGHCPAIEYPKLVARAFRASGG